MTVALTYDGTLSRVRIAVTALDARVDEVLIQRSTDQITWTTVRGGAALPVSGAAASLDDYEFTTGVVNYYRVRGVDNGAITFVAAGAADTDNNATVTPALPAGLAQHDLLLILASIRNSGTGTPNTPAGFDVLANAANMRLFGKRASASESTPTVTFTGGAANADTIAQCAAFRNAELTPVTSNVQLNASAQDIAFPGLTLTDDGLAVVAAGWKQDDWTSVAALAGMTEIGEPDSTLGDDAGQVWDYRIDTTAASLAAGSFVVTGGAAAISRGLAVAFEGQAYLSEETSSITPSVTSVWIKSVARPFLNHAYDRCVKFGDITRDARNGIFDVVGRSYPVAVTDVRGSRKFTLDVITDGTPEAEHLDLTLASGDVLFLQPPAGSPIPTMYAVVEDTVESRLAPWLESRDCPQVLHRFLLPLVEVAAPSAELVGASYTWQGVLNDYATWSDVLAANATWADLLENLSAAGEVIVP